MVDLEIWLTGTPAELDAAAHALAAIGRVVYHSDRWALAGTDTGRHRTYARIRVHSQPAAHTGPGTPSRAPTLTDLAA